MKEKTFKFYNAGSRGRAEKHIGQDVIGLINLDHYSFNGATTMRGKLVSISDKTGYNYLIKNGDIDGYAFGIFVEVDTNPDFLMNFDENWDGFGSKKPNLKSIETAKEFLNILDEESSPDCISADENGDVVLEWCNGDKKITVLCKESGIILMKVDPDVNIYDEHYFISCPSGVVESFSYFKYFYRKFLKND